MTWRSNSLHRCPSQAVIVATLDWNRQLTSPCNSLTRCGPTRAVSKSPISPNFSSLRKSTKVIQAQTSVGLIRLPWLRCKSHVSLSGSNASNARGLKACCTKCVSTSPPISRVWWWVAGPLGNNSSSMLMKTPTTCSAYRLTRQRVSARLLSGRIVVKFPVSASSTKTMKVSTYGATLRGSVRLRCLTRSI